MKLSNSNRRCSYSMMIHIAGLFPFLIEKCMSTDQEGTRYFRISSGELCPSPEYEKVESIEECINAAKLLNRDSYHVNRETRFNYPKGCYMFLNSVFWNYHTVGSHRNDTDLICKTATKCFKKWTGGCREWRALRIYNFDSRSYSVRECYELCFKEKLCDGFVISISAKCELFTKGCTKSNDRNWSYYAMDTCNFDHWIVALNNENCDTACGRSWLKCSEEGFEQHNYQVDNCEKVKILTKDLIGSEVDKCNPNHWAKSDIPVLEFDSGRNKETVGYHSYRGKLKSMFDCTKIPPQSKKRRLCFCHDELTTTSTSITTSTTTSTPTTTTNSTPPNTATTIANSTLTRASLTTLKPDLTVIIAGSAAGFMLLILIIVFSFCLVRKNKKPTESMGEEKELDNYDGLNYDEMNNQPNENIYGNKDEANEFEAMQNPYYGGDIDDGPTVVKTVQNPYYGGDI